MAPNASASRKVQIDHNCRLCTVDVGLSGSCRSRSSKTCPQPPPGSHTGLLTPAPYARRWDIGTCGADEPTAGASPQQQAVEQKPTAIEPTILDSGPEPAPAVAPFNAQQARRHQEAWAKHLGVPVELTNSIGMRFAAIPPGEFTMGSPELDQVTWNPEKPQHRVRITRPFYMGILEVTQEQFKGVTDTTPSHFSQGGKGADKISDQDTSRLPVESVSWNDAVSFNERLSAITEERSAQRAYRLPLEAKWEYACRGGTATACYFGKTPSRMRNLRDVNDHAWWGAFEISMVPITRCHIETNPHPGGQKKPNAWGLYDMYGNVEEWCQDWYGPEYYDNAPLEDPPGPSAGSKRVPRGGSWSGGCGFCRSAYRDGEGQDTRRFYLGFRVALDIPEKTAQPPEGK